MKILEVIVENREIDEISLGGVGKALAKGVRGTAKAVGATAGGAAGAWQAAKQGYQAGKAAVAGTNTPPSVTTPSTATTPPITTPSSIGSPMPAVSTAYVQAKGMVDKLDKKGKQRILAKLQKDLSGATTAPKATPAPTTTTATPVPNLQVQPGGKQKAALLQPQRTATPESKFYSNYLKQVI